MNESATSPSIKVVVVARQDDERVLVIAVDAAGIVSKEEAVVTNSVTEMRALGDIIVIFFVIKMVVGERAPIGYTGIFDSLD